MIDDEKERAVETPDPATEANAVARLEAEVADLKDRLLRALAEQENVRRRAAREREDAAKLAAEDLVRDLLPTADNLRRAIASASEQPDPFGSALVAGVVASERALLEAFAKHGILPINPAPGEPFDPHRHEAMFEVENASQPAGTIAEIVQPGYAYRHRVLRPALVSVSKGGVGKGESGEPSAANDRGETPADNG